MLNFNFVISYSISFVELHNNIKGMSLTTRYSTIMLMLKHSLEFLQNV